MHGTRSEYQRGCRCCPCRAANAAYEASYRQDKAHGYSRAKLPASEARKLITALKVEWFDEQRIAGELGLHDKRLRLHPSRITREKFAKIKALHDRYMAEGPDEPLDAAHS